MSESWHGEPQRPDGRSPTSPRPSQQNPLARSHRYELFGRLYLEGLNEQTFDLAQAIPELAAVLPQVIDFDELAADHQHLFSFNLYPYQSIFLDSSGLLGGEVTAGILDVYREAGFDAGVSGESADHIGHELRFLSYLCGLEAESSRSQRAIIWQATFLGQHLLRWLPALVLAVQKAGYPFYAGLARLSLEQTAGHWAKLDVGPVGFARQEPPDLLADEQTGLKEIVAYLLSPVYSGFFLSRDDIGRLARQLSLPRGFGGRQQMLGNLLRSAANYDAVPAVLELLRDQVNTWIEGYREMGKRSELAPFSDAWLARATQTAGLIDDIEGSLHELE